ncbi:uncharacterized protein N7506_000235 [Penicillium brevicompactum]|uniref:uncharacterized protein n=1 Tax=Penicillium brevicompactum TaxID=5074 RepID=UPI00253F9C51|nr:uncharacterized protein N7506_000235 [Penicillium brevicompactum]KAJ5346982.1 hypothetical protein N7506_000235 [Penicillium brevicompactum]
MDITENPSVDSNPPSENSPREVEITALSEENICRSPQRNTFDLLLACVKELDERTQTIENCFQEQAAYNARLQIEMEQLRDEVHGFKEREFGLKTRVNSICKSLGISTIQGNPARLPKAARQRRARIKQEPGSA